MEDLNNVNYKKEESRAHSRLTHVSFNEKYAAEQDEIKQIVSSTEKPGRQNSENASSVSNPKSEVRSNIHELYRNDN